MSTFCRHVGCTLFTEVASHYGYYILAKVIHSNLLFLLRRNPFDGHESILENTMMPEIWGGPKVEKTKLPYGHGLFS